MHVLIDGTTYVPEKTSQVQIGWQPIDTAPEGDSIVPTEVDVWMEIPASVISMGMSDSFRIPNAYRKGDRWYHRTDSGVEKELQREYITHWMHVPSAPN